jgi:hypothetical protein
VSPAIFSLPSPAIGAGGGGASGRGRIVAWRRFASTPCPTSPQVRAGPPLGFRHRWVDLYASVEVFSSEFRDFSRLSRAELPRRVYIRLGFCGLRVRVILGLRVLLRTTPQG